MAYLKFSVSSLVFTLATWLLFAAGYSGPFLFLPALVGLLLAVKAYLSSPSSNLAVAVGQFNGLSAALIFYLLTGDYFIPLAIVIAAASSHFKMRVARFNYTSWLYAESSLSLLSIVLYVLGNLKGQFGWTAWFYAGVPVFLFFVINLGNLYDRSKIANIKGSYTAVGQPAPDFSLQNEDGNTVRLSDYKGSILLLVFVRGDWCPGCHIMLRTYEKHRQTLQDKGVTLLSIGPDPIGVNKEMAQKIGLHYHILSDPDQKVAMKYTVELQEPIPITPKEYAGIPLPASFLVDKEGIVRHTSRVENPGEILYPDAIIETLKRIA